MGFNDCFMGFNGVIIDSFGLNLLKVMDYRPKSPQSYNSICCLRKPATRPKGFMRMLLEVNKDINDSFNRFS